jgi:ABC-2 type transport system ATP-binding protein
MSSQNRIIRVEGLAKTYGDVRALANVSFSVQQGEIFAYLGPNGAGKTTTINILCGLLRRDAGGVTIEGRDIEQDPVVVKARIGVLPETSNLYPELTCRRNLEYLGELYGLARAYRRSKADELLDSFDLAEKAAAPFGSLSRGMKRRLTVAAALVHSPKIVFLDEPTVGLDVPSARALRSLIQTINKDGTTVFLTTHNFAEAELLCNHIVILIKGRIVVDGPPAEISKQVAKAKTLAVAFSEDVNEAVLREACPAIRSMTVADDGWRLDVTSTHEAVGQLMRLADKEGFRILEIDTITPSLEDAFMTILEAGTNEREAGP